MYLFTTVPYPRGHWQLQELLGNHNMMMVQTTYSKKHAGTGLTSDVRLATSEPGGRRFFLTRDCTTKIGPMVFVT